MTMTLSNDVMRTAEVHLGLSCEVMAGLVARHGPCTLLERDFSPFVVLSSSIIGQQLSAKAAETIKRRVWDLVPQFTPRELLAVPADSLRGAGLSASKAKYITELARRIEDGRFDFTALSSLDDESAISALTNLPGVGRWTAEMFLIFGLGRPDIMSLGDAGLQRAARLLYGGTASLEAISERWRPYRSLASWYLWRHLD